LTAGKHQKGGGGMGTKLTVEEGGKKDTGAKEESVDIKHARANVYFGSQVELLKRFVILAMAHRGVSVSALIVTCCAACIDTLETDMPTKRVFKLNGRNVEL
jgi:hypothetical protein